MGLRTYARLRSGEKFGWQQEALVLGRLAGGPVDTVLAVELSGERPTRQPTILSVLREPGCVFAVSIEAEAQSRMASNVVDGAEPVVWSAGLTLEHRMAPIATSWGADHL